MKHEQGRARPNGAARRRGFLCCLILCAPTARDPWPCKLCVAFSRQCCCMSRIKLLVTSSLLPLSLSSPSSLQSSRGCSPRWHILSLASNRRWLTFQSTCNRASQRTLGTSTPKALYYQPSRMMTVQGELHARLARERGSQTSSMMEWALRAEIAIGSLFGVPGRGKCDRCAVTRPLHAADRIV
jgi:hypothetical protein